jgi:hypothetical protein
VVADIFVRPAVCTPSVISSPNGTPHITGNIEPKFKRVVIIGYEIFRISQGTHNEANEDKDLEKNQHSDEKYPLTVIQCPVLNQNGTKNK